MPQEHHKPCAELGEDMDARTMNKVAESVFVAALCHRQT